MADINHRAEEMHRLKRRQVEDEARYVKRIILAESLAERFSTVDQVDGINGELEVLVEAQGNGFNPSNKGVVRCF